MNMYCILFLKGLKHLMNQLLKLLEDDECGDGVKFRDLFLWLIGFGYRSLTIWFLCRLETRVLGFPFPMFCCFRNVSLPYNFPIR